MFELQLAMNPLSMHCYDASGKRIESDILVIGYIRQLIENLHKMNVPNDIKLLCFKYWLINICDEWNEEYFPKDKAQIIGQVLKVISNYNAFTVFGKETVENGCHKWILRINKSMPFDNNYQPYIGVIVDDVTILKSCMKNIWNTNDGSKGYLFCGSAKVIAPPRTGVKFGKDYFSKTNDVIEMILDLNNNTLQYIINGKDQGIAFKNILKNKYRLAVGFGSAKGWEMELL